MSYAAILRGEQSVLEAIGPCFASPEARIRALDEHWLLETSRFDNCSSVDEAFKIADQMVIEIQGLLSIYAGLNTSISVSSMLTLGANGEPVRQRLRDFVTIRVYSAAGLRELSESSNVTSLGSMLVARAADDPAVAEALMLIGERGLGWPQIYDIIEFLGGAKAIDSTGLGSRSQTARVRRTANHYRHLGRRDPDRLPINPPTLAEARLFATGLLKRWLGTRL
jgi:hypothetical protein